MKITVTLTGTVPDHMGAHLRPGEDFGQYLSDTVMATPGQAVGFLSGLPDFAMKVKTAGSGPEAPATPAPVAEPAPVEVIRVSTQSRRRVRVSTDEGARSKKR